jgi:hypothetical protein
MNQKCPKPVLICPLSRLWQRWPQMLSRCKKGTIWTRTLYVNHLYPAEVMAKMVFSMVLHHFYRETWVRASNLYTVSSWSYHRPVHSILLSQECDRSPRGVSMERELFQTSLMLLVYWLANGQDIMDCKGQWWLRWETLSRAIHFEHVCHWEDKW